MKLEKREYIGLGILFLVLVIAYQKGLFSKDKGRQLSTTGSNSAVTDGSAPSLQTAQYQNKANAIYTSLSGYGQGLSGELWNILTDLKNMSEADLISTANAYAALYPNDDYPTLYALLQSTTTVFYTSTYDLKYEVLERLKKLGL